MCAGRVGRPGLPSLASSCGWVDRTYQKIPAAPVIAPATFVHGDACQLQVRHSAVGSARHTMCFSGEYWKLMTTATDSKASSAKIRMPAVPTHPTYERIKECLCFHERPWKQAYHGTTHTAVRSVVHVGTVQSTREGSQTLSSDQTRTSENPRKPHRVRGGGKGEGEGRNEGRKEGGMTGNGLREAASSS